MSTLTDLAGTYSRMAKVRSRQRGLLQRQHLVHHHVQLSATRRRELRGPHGTCRAIVDEGLADPDPWHGFCLVIEKVCELHARNRGFAAAGMLPVGLIAHGSEHAPPPVRHIKSLFPNGPWYYAFGTSDARLGG